MKTSSPFKLIFIVLLNFMASTLNAQTQDICAEGDCSSEIMAIQLDGPLKVDPANLPDNKRTEQYKAAYLKVKQIKNQEELKPGWKNKYETNQLTGRSCARLNQLESYFANEYIQNPDFKKFIDAAESDSEAFKENGFESSRRAINMITRMKDKCPQEVNKLDKSQGPQTKEVPQAFMNLGIEQGYFDKDGNKLKDMKDLSGEQNNSSDTAPKKLSKKQQVENLKNKVAGLPIGPGMQDKIGDVASGLAAAKPKLGLLENLLSGLKPKLTNLLNKPKDLLSKLGKTGDLLGNLKKFNPKVPKPDLLSKIGNLFDKGKELADQAKDLANKANKLNNDLDNAIKDKEKANKDLADQEAKINELKDKLDDLQQKQQVLKDKLEDKPRKILEELTNAVHDLEGKSDELTGDVNKEKDKKEQLLNKIDDLEKKKDDIEKKLKGLEDIVDDLTNSTNKLEEDADKSNNEVEACKKNEAALDAMADKLDDLKADEALKEALILCEDELKALLGKITALDQVQERVKKKAKGIFAWPGKLLDKIKNLKIFQNKLKLGKNGIPVVGNVLGKIDQLLGKANVLSSKVELLTGKKSKLQEKIENLDQKVGKVKEDYESRVANLENLQGELVNLIAEKSGLKDKLNKGANGIDAMDAIVQDFIKRYQLFDEKDECISLDDLKDKIKEVEGEQADTEKDLEDLEDELEEADKQEAELEEETKEVEKEIEEEAKKAEELKAEEEALQEEFGEEVKLEPVKVEEWAEEFEIERPYWEALFHPDDEVVEGYKGRYFEVQLKDASKSVKLLFGPGEYFKERTDFLKNYGATIGSFVREALHHLKKTDQEKVVVFIQGSADIAGHETFSGILDERFLFDEITVLPQNADDKERFLSEASTMDVPKTNFRNDHLPNLRARYLKEMISIYSKKFDPVLLEGAVKNVQDIKERNAIIYIFFPETLLSEYGN